MKRPIETVPSAAEIRRRRRAAMLTKYGACLGRIVAGEAKSGDAEAWVGLGDELGLSDADLEHDRRVRVRYAEAERIAAESPAAADPEPAEPVAASSGSPLGLLAVPKQLTVEQQREHWLRVGRRQQGGRQRRAREDLANLPELHPRAFGSDAEPRRPREAPSPTVTVAASKPAATSAATPAAQRPDGVAFEQGRKRWLADLAEKQQPATAQQTAAV